MTTQRSPGLFRRLAHGSSGKTTSVGLVLGFFWHGSQTRGGSCWLVRYFVRRRTESRCPLSSCVDAGDGTIANHQHGQKTNIRPILFLFYLLAPSLLLWPRSLHVALLYSCIYPVARVIFRRQALSK